MQNPDLCQERILTVFRLIFMKCSFFLLSESITLVMFSLNQFRIENYIFSINFKVLLWWNLNGSFPSSVCCWNRIFRSGFWWPKNDRRSTGFTHFLFPTREFIPFVAAETHRQSAKVVPMGFHQHSCVNCCIKRKIFDCTLVGNNTKCQ